MSKEIIKGFRVTDEDLALIQELKKKIRAKTDSDVFREALYNLATEKGILVVVPA